MLSSEALEIIRNRSKELKQLEKINTDKRLIRIQEILKKLPENDDAYYLGYLYGMLIDIYLKKKQAIKVVEYVNKVILLSGMALYEYCGPYCPFSAEKIKKVLNCYFQVDIIGDYSKLWGKGRILQLQGKYDEAISFYKKLIEYDKSNINNYRMLARLYEELYDFDCAQEYFEKAEKIKKDPLTQCMMATIAIKQYQFQKAEHILTKTIQENPDYSFAQYRLIEVLEKQNKIKELKKQRQLLIKNNPNNTKYVLLTISEYDETILKELKQMKQATSEGIDYSSLNKYFGHYYYHKCISQAISEEESFLYSEKALEYYRKAINNNKFCYQAYYNQINLLMKKTQVILTSKKEDNEERKRVIENLITVFPNAIDIYIYFKYADTPIEQQIQILKTAIKEHPHKQIFYYYLANCYLYQSNDSIESKNSLIELCNLQIEKFPTSAAVFFDCYEYFQKIMEYDKADECIKKALVLSDNNLDIQIISQKLQFYKNTDSVTNLTKQIENSFNNLLNESFYLELAVLYYNKCYETKDFTTDYTKISLYFFKKAINLNKELLKSEELSFIYSLLLFCNQEEKKAFELYNRIDEEKLPLIVQIKDCFDIFHIKILYSLFEHKYTKNKAKIICFWSQVLLCLLRYNLFEDQSYRISHYTSIEALNSMLSDENMTSFRLSSLGSANDPKEGKIFFDFLTENIKDKELCLKIQSTPQIQYTAVQASFTKLEDALTMFRLYGKKEKNEGTGVNLVFNENFFSKSFKIPFSKNKKYISFEKNDKQLENFIDQKDFAEPLHWVLYWDKNKKMYFNPQGIYKTLEIDLINNQNWYVLNKEQKELKNSPNSFYEKYAKNISYVLNKIKESFETFTKKYNSLQEIHSVKEELLNISYLIKDAAFYDEKELRLIKVESLNNNILLKHDNSRFTLYKEYSMLTGFYRYPKSCPLEKIILGPKVEQKETLREYLLNHLDKAGIPTVKVEFSQAPLA